ncbi:hypothetical protein E1301_Tti021441 [Triplophysa tibetana]|uniref:Uncharacterized protein n=1 Tax=Triplophysa tibetana TaxID=1572043 RepID=A0A5A9PHR5_9TELE|nr:hypothetical protein E1301_Tti021441 [Triplophysa tibetana]
MLQRMQGNIKHSSSTGGVSRSSIFEVIVEEDQRHHSLNLLYEKLHVRSECDRRSPKGRSRKADQMTQYWRNIYFRRYENVFTGLAILQDKTESERSWDTRGDKIDMESAGDHGDIQQYLPEQQESFSLFAGIPQSTPQTSRRATELPTKFKVTLPLHLTLSAQTVTCTKPFAALAPTWTHLELHRRWKSMLHHISEVHRWEENGMEYKCYHEELTRDQDRMKKWLSVHSPAYKALVEIVMDTQQLEVFHIALLKYCPNRLHFEYAAMQTHTMLAVIDHIENHTTQREQAATAGLPRPNVVFQKQSNQWIATPIYTKTTQTFTSVCMEGVIESRSDHTVKFKALTPYQNPSSSS